MDPAFVPGPATWLLALGAWVGHAYLLTALLNNLYGRTYPKPLLRAVRAAVGLLILGFPGVVWLATRDGSPALALLLGPYLWGCSLVGLAWFPAVTAYRALRRPPACVSSELTETVDYRKELGDAVIGNGKHPRAARLPGNHTFRVDYTEMTLAVPGLPAAWDGLTVLLLSDVHFHGTPSRAWFDRVFDRIAGGPTPDLVVLAGDYVDTPRHHDWIGPLLGRLKWHEAGVAVLGNHDAEQNPDVVRGALAAAGYRVVSNRWDEITVRGERCVVVGHEGPWIGPPPDLSGVPAGVFKLCVSHTPDNFPWGVKHGLNLMLCGHVHGGQIRVPLVGSIFVPSVYGRRYDMGVFAEGKTVMVVGRGLSGKEPLRWRCHPQVIRLTLRPS